MNTFVTRSRGRRVASAVALALALPLSGLALTAGPASATHNPQRAAACQAVGGVYAGSGNSETCTVTTSVDGAAVPDGAPTTELSDPTPVGQPVETARVNRPAGEPTIEEDTYTVGNPEVVSEETVPAGEPTVEQETVEGKPTTTETPTTTNCQRINSPKANKPVERCERAVLFTTTTPTTVITTTTTPQKTVTVTSQERETLITTTQPTEDLVTYTQQTERTATVTQPTKITTIKTVTTYRFQGNSLAGSPTVTSSTSERAGEPIVTEETVPGEPIVTQETQAADPIVTEETVPAAPLVETTEKKAPDMVVVTETEGAPIVTEEVRSTGETCYKNPATPEQRRNRC